MKHEAGRELDALVAERVMGLTLGTVGTQLYYEGNGSLEILPRYSTDIAAAWEVVEKMHVVHGFEGHNEFLLVCSDEDEAWYCEFPKPKWEDASANTPSLAICLAALKAVGYELP